MSLKLEKKLENELYEKYTGVMFQQIIDVITRNLDYPSMNLNILENELYMLLSNYDEWYNELMDSYVEQSMELARQRHQQYTELLHNKEVTNSLLSDDITKKSWFKLISNKVKSRFKRTRKKTSLTGKLKAKNYRLKRQKKYTNSTFSKRTTKKVSRVIQKHYKNKKDTVHLKKSLNDKLRKIFNEDAKRMAESIIQGSKNESAYDEIMNDESIKNKQWITQGDDKVRDSHAELEGTIIPKDEVFPNGLEFPRDDRGDAEEVINCRCELLPA